MKNIYCLLLYISLFLPGLGQADEFIKPSARLSAEEVVEIQLLGLQAAGDDRPAGIEQVWRFAHPDNRKVTGPITRFSRLFDLPAYAPLIGLRDYVINDRVLSENRARFVITIRAVDGAAYGYIWSLRTLPARLSPSLAEDTDEADLVWMTTAVSAPYAGGGS